MLDGGSSVWSKSLRLQCRQSGVKLLKLPHLSLGTPAKITVLSVSEVGDGDRGELPHVVKATRKFVRDRLVVNKPIGTRRKNGPLIKLFGFQSAAFDPCNFSANYCGTA